MISKIAAKVFQTQNKLPKKVISKQVVISSKKGVDSVENIYMGAYPRTSIIDVLRDLFERYILK